MNTLQIVAVSISLIGTIITTVLAWVVIYRVNKVQVSFTGEPVDKKEFDRQGLSNDAVHAQIFSRIGGVERGAAQSLKEYELAANESLRAMHRDVETIGRQVSSLSTATEGNTSRLVQLDCKIDRLMERPHRL
jgi:hypothetical protein